MAKKKPTQKKNVARRRSPVAPATVGPITLDEAKALVAPQRPARSLKQRKSTRKVSRKRAAVRGAALSSPSVSNPKISKAADAFRRIPSDGALLTFTGDFDRSGANTHIQGAVQMPDFHVLSYSNEGSDRGLLLALSDADRRLVHTVDVPNDAGRPLYHAGGVQRLGDVIAVASESQENFSVVTFVDAQRLVTAGEAVEIARPIRRTNKDAMAVGVTDITLNGETKWLAGVYQKGTIDVYLHPNILDTTIEWEHKGAVEVKEQNHQSFLLFAEAQAAGSDDQLYAVGLNHGNIFYSHRATLYRMTLADSTPTLIAPIDSREDFDFKSKATLRFGGGMEVVGADFQLYGTERAFTGDCVVQRFAQQTGRSARAHVRDRAIAVEATPEPASLTGKVPLPTTPVDLSDGVIVVLSGGPFDAMNPPEVIDHMERLIDDVNADPWVRERTGGVGLRFKLLSGQINGHLHQSKWRNIRTALQSLKARPLIVVGHSNGGAAAVDLSKTLATDGRTVDLLITADSVATLDDVGDINRIPPNVRFNMNSYVIPMLAWMLAPFPIGERNVRAVESAATALVNLGLQYNLPGALAHRNAFYELNGGDIRNNVPEYPLLMRDVLLAILRETPADEVVVGIAESLQILADGTQTVIELESRQLTRTIRPRP